MGELKLAQDAAPVKLEAAPLLVWYAMLCGHFFVCCCMAYVAGDPARLPVALHGLDRLLRYRVSGILMALQVAVWFVGVTALLIGLWWLLKTVGRLVGKEDLWAGAPGPLWLPTAVSLLTLWITPVSGRSASVSSQAASMTLVEFLGTLLQNTCAMLVVVVFLAVTMLVVSLFTTRFKKAGGCASFGMFFVGVVCGIAAIIPVAAGVMTGFAWCTAHFTAAGCTLIVFATYSAVSLAVYLLITRR